MQGREEAKKIPNVVLTLRSLNCQPLQIGISHDEKDWYELNNIYGAFR